MTGKRQGRLEGNRGSPGGGLVGHVSPRLCTRPHPSTPKSRERLHGAKAQVPWLPCFRCWPQIQACSYSLAVCRRGKKAHTEEARKKKTNHRTTQVSRFFPTLGRRNATALDGGAGEASPRSQASAPAVQDHRHPDLESAGRRLPPGLIPCPPARTGVSPAWGLQGAWALGLSGRDPGGCWSLWCFALAVMVSLTCWSVLGCVGVTLLWS